MTTLAACQSTLAHISQMSLEQRSNWHCPDSPRVWPVLETQERPRKTFGLSYGTTLAQAPDTQQANTGRARPSAQCQSLTPLRQAASLPKGIRLFPSLSSCSAICSCCLFTSPVCHLHSHQSIFMSADGEGATTVLEHMHAHAHRSCCKLRQRARRTAKGQLQHNVTPTHLSESFQGPFGSADVGLKPGMHSVLAHFDTG